MKQFWVIAGVVGAVLTGANYLAPSARVAAPETDSLWAFCYTTELDTLGESSSRIGWITDLFSIRGAETTAAGADRAPKRAETVSGELDTLWFSEIRQHDPSFATSGCVVADRRDVVQRAHQERLATGSSPSASAPMNERRQIAGNQLESLLADTRWEIGVTHHRVSRQ